MAEIPMRMFPEIPYFEDLFPDAAGGGLSATQNIYTQVWAANRGNETGALYDIDVGCFPGCGGQTGRYYQDQFSSLFAWSSIGSSSYNAGQLILRHAMSHGLQLDLSYTLSNSIDLGSDTERTNELYNQVGVFQQGSSFSTIINSFSPQLNRGVSDFDTRHLISGDWVYQLPFGQGQAFCGRSRAWIECTDRRLAAIGVEPVEQRTSVWSCRAGVDDQLAGGKRSGSDRASEAPQAFDQWSAQCLCRSDGTQ